MRARGRQRPSLASAFQALSSRVRFDPCREFTQAFFVSTDLILTLLFPLLRIRKLIGPGASPQPPLLRLWTSLSWILRSRPLAHRTREHSRRGGRNYRSASRPPTALSLSPFSSTRRAPPLASLPFPSNFSAKARLGGKSPSLFSYPTLTVLTLRLLPSCFTASRLFSSPFRDKSSLLSTSTSADPFLRL